MPPRTGPDVSVVVASHRREDRLPRLLGALAAQTVPRESWELVVVHTYDERTADSLFGSRERSQTGPIRALPFDRISAAPAPQRNIGWRAAKGRLVAFTDDDCRPERDWLERLVAGADANPGAVIQGATQPDPLDADALGATHVRTLLVDPPGRYTQTCNILYERRLLERLDGFDEGLIVGEDIDLGLRAKAAGAEVVGAPDAVVYHATESLSLPEKIRANEKWADLALLVKKHPELRRQCELRVWWKPEHSRAVLALAALIGAAHSPWAIAGVLPYWMLEPERGRYGPTRRDRLRAMRRLPQYWLVDLAEVGTFVRGSLRHRTLLL